MEAGKCPKCHSDNLTYGASQAYDHYISYLIYCNNCHFGGTEDHSIQFVGFTDSEGNEL